LNFPQKFQRVFFLHLLLYKFDYQNNFYKVIFNGTPDKFLEVMSDQNYDFEIKNKIWVLNDKS